MVKIWRSGCCRDAWGVVPIRHSALLQSGLLGGLAYNHPERWIRDNVLAEDRGYCVLERAVALLLQSRKPQVHQLTEHSLARPSLNRHQQVTWPAVPHCCSPTLCSVLQLLWPLGQSEETVPHWPNTGLLWQCSSCGSLTSVCQARGSDCDNELCERANVPRRLTTATFSSDSSLGRAAVLLATASIWTGLDLLRALCFH